jgi:RHS repeat-associated protein
MGGRERRGPRPAHKSSRRNGRRQSRRRRAWLTASAAFIVLALLAAAWVRPAGTDARAHSAVRSGVGAIALSASRQALATRRHHAAGSRRLTQRPVLCSTVVRRPKGAHVLRNIEQHCLHMLGRTSVKHHGSRRHTRTSVPPPPSGAASGTRAVVAATPKSKPPAPHAPATKHQCSHTATTSGCVSQTLANLLPALAPSGTGQIAGTVTSAATSKPIEGIEVCAHNEVAFGCSSTEASGEYHIGGLAAGEYTVYFTVPFELSADYLTQYYKDKSNYAEATPVVVTSAATTSGIDAAMQLGGQITGKVTNAATKAAIEGIEACAQPRGESYYSRCAKSNASGEYDIVGLATEEYTIVFLVPYNSKLNYVRQYYNGKEKFDEASPISVTAGATTANINAALHPGGQIAGKVTDAVTKAAVGEIQVCAYGGPEGASGCALTNSSGEYQIGGLPTGTYTVEFAPPYGENTGNYLRQYYNGKTSSTQAEPVAVTVGSTTPNINAALEPGGQIGGTVTDATSKAALGEIQVCASENSGEFIDRCATTNSSGGYIISGLPTALYTVVFSDLSGPHATQYYKNKVSYNEAQPVSVTAATLTPSINAAMQLGAEISGKVTDATTKAALSGITVCPSAVNAYVSTGCVSTNENGEYALSKLPAAEYRIEFATYSQNYLRQYYNGKANSGEANLVTVSAGGTASGINAALHQGAEISGTVTSAASKAKLGGIEVCAFGTSGEFVVRCAATNSGGEYTVVGLPTGDYTVSFASGNEYAPQYYDNKATSSEATPVAVVAGSLTPNINAALAAAAEITGVVTNATTKAPIGEVEVCAQVASSGTYAQCQNTNASGEYKLAPLAAGEYKVEFAPFSGSTANYTAQYYNNKPTFAEADVVSVAAGGAASNINAALREAGKITGTVTDFSTKAPIEGIEVCAHTSTGEYVGRCGFTNASGEYAVTALATGEFKVEFSGNGHNYLTQFYNGKATLTEGQLVSVTSGETTSAINAELHPGGKITGVVTATVSKAPIGSVDVCAYPKNGGYVLCGLTNASGEYSIVALATGEYTVQFQAYGQNYITQYYNGKASFGEAQLLSITAGTTTPNINAALELGGEITGTVTAAKTKEPIANIEAYVYTTSGSFFASASTNANGEYTVLALPTGEYKVEFYSYLQEYRTQYYNSKESLTEATAISAKAGGNVTPNINAALLIAPPVVTSLPTISGSDQQGHTLNEAHGTWRNQPTEFTYHWLRCNKTGGECGQIGGATEQSYVPVFLDVGHALRVEETAHNEGGANTATSEPTAPIVVAPPENTKPPGISGTAQQGKTLTDVAGTWSNEPTKFKYQWLQCSKTGTECEAIATAKGSTYIPVAGDVHHELRVEETAENGAGASAPATSAATAVVVPPIPVNTSPPTITGTAQQGETLTEHHGSWEYSPTEYKLQWLACEKLGNGCLPISGATGETYVPGPLEVGGTLRVEEAATNEGGTSAYVPSAPTAEVLPAPPVNVSAPTISGTAQQGKMLTEHNGSWENNATSFKHQWLRCNKEGGECAAVSPILNASEVTYEPTSADVGHTIRVEEIASNAGGTGKPATSAATAVVVPPVSVNESLPTITGIAKQGKTLTAHHGTWSNAPSSFEDKWLRCAKAGTPCEAIGATGETYTAVTGDVGHVIRVEEIATNEGGPSAPATSEPTALVLSAAPENETPPTTSGTAQQGQTLTGHHGTWSNEPTGYGDTWLRCNEAGEECGPTGGTGETYEPVAKDVGHTIRLEETAHNEGGTSAPALSKPTSVVLPAAPVNITKPTITGEPVQGKTLTEHHGTWENTPTGYKLHWLQCDELGVGCLPIGGAEGETYKPTALDVGHAIRVEEVASNAGGSSEPATSDPTAVVKSAPPVNITPPTITGIAQKGQTQVEQHGTWTNEPTGYAYKWERCSKTGTECEAIAAAVDQTYLATATDVGRTLKVSEVASNAGGESAPATSGASEVIAPVPLHAVAGEGVSGTAGVAVTLDGSGSTPASEIEKYSWEFGDGSEAEGESVSHSYTSPGTYTAKLTITRGAESTSASVTVTVAPAPTHTATVEVTDASHNPLSGATVLYIGPGDVRIQAATGGDGKASLAGLPAGTDAVYAYRSGFQPAVGQVTVSGEEGETTIALASGEIATSTLKSHEMTLKEIEEAGINVNDPANQNVYEFEVRLAFIESTQESVQFHCYINKEGEFVGGCTGGGGGGGGWGGGGGGPSCSPHECVGSGIVAVPSIVDGKPLIQWLILRGKASVLKQFFSVSEVVQNLSPEPFKLAAGTTTLNVPPGMSLAPTATPQSATQSVAAIPGNGSAETTWVVRGDTPGEYFLSANYHSKLEPFEAPVDLEARLASPLKVWGVEALSLNVQADEGFLAEGRPYHVHIGVTDKANIPLYNVNVEILLNVHERFIFQPDQEAAHMVSELKPGETVYAPQDILVPDAASEAPFNPALSSAHFVGEEIHPGVGIEAVKPPPLYTISAPTDTPHYIHLHWQATPGAEGYEVFSTPELDTAFAAEPNEVLASPGSKTRVTKLPANATDAYLPGNGHEDFYAVTSLVGGRAALSHTVIKAAEGQTGGGGGPLGGALSPGELGPGGGNASESCLCSIAKFLSFVLPVDGPAGNFWHSFSDFAISGRGLPLELTRTYNSTFAANNGPFGFGWTFPYGMHLTFPDAKHVVVNQENGSQITFEEGPGGTYTAPPRVQATLTHTEGTWQLTRRHREFFAFNGSGQLTQEHNLNGYTSHLTYNAKGQVVRVADPSGRKLTFTYSGGHIATATDPLGHSFHYEYDSAGDLTDVIDPAGGDSHFTYDTQHRMLTMRTPNQAPGVPGSTGAGVTNVYDSQGRVTEQTDQLGHTTKFEYSGEPFAEAGGTTTVTNPVGDVTVQNYKFGLLQSETQGSGTSSAATWSFEYDPATLGVVAATDPRGHTTTSKYDGEGNVLSRTDPLGHTTEFTYDSLNEVLTMTDPLKVTTTLTYDARGNKLTESTPLAGTSGTQTTRYLYEAKTFPGEITAKIDPQGFVTRYAYDKYGNQTSVTNPDNNTTTTTYNIDGWKTASVSARGIAKGEPANFTTTYGYNVLGQLTEVVEPLGHKTTREYDPDQNLIATTDTEGHTTHNEFDAADQQVAVRRADGSTTHTVYNTDGTVKEEIDAAGHATTYGYDPLGRRTRVTDARGRTTEYGYDKAGNTVTVKDPEGNVTTTEYDADNREASVTYGDGKTPNVTGITYDGDGQRTGETNGAEVWAWSWDSLHRLTSITEGSNGTVTYGYNMRNLLATIHYPHKLVVQRNYDAAGRWTSVSDSRGNITNFAYDQNGNLTTEKLPSGTATTDSSTYNNADELGEINDVAHGAPLFQAHYARNSDSQITSDSSAPAAEGSYKYNSLSQVCYAGSASTEECSTPPSGATPYKYDAAGNITRNNSTSLTYDAADQLCWSIAPAASGACASAPSGATTYAYNERGDRTSATPASGPASHYEYDQAGRLVHFAHGKTTNASYTYSGDGLRMSKTVGKAVTTFAWDASTGQPLVLEENKVAYVYGPENRPLEQITGTKVLWLHHDQLGSTRAVTNATGETVATYNYSPYGSLTSSTGTIKMPLRYAGQYQDAESGLYYMLARYYDSTTAQFMTPDPAGTSAVGSPYAYVYGDPLNYADPLGLWGLPDLNPIDWGKAAVHTAANVAVGAYHAVKQVAVWAAPVAKVVQGVASTVSTITGDIAGVCAAGALITSETIVGGIGFGACAAVAGGVSTATSAVATVADADLWLATGKPGDFWWDLLGTATFGEDKGIENLLKTDGRKYAYDFGKWLVGQGIGLSAGALCPSSA